MEASPRKVHYMDRHDTSMTEGPIFSHLIWFALPLMVGYIFQQLYNAVDSIIVGRFVSMQALAAVGSTGNIINTLIGHLWDWPLGQASSLPRTTAPARTRG